ncbi:hypothetical protein [Modestobacter altitudinis]|uniref:hypothetical protein n=1 Tax=Modestobacter altitudinis TaxID=2213158 RepID=UPI00110CF2A3|nr:hypothetical protein [Modestobacter altitudinis]
MNGTLTIEGDLAILGKIAADITAQYPNGVTAAVETASWEGWDTEVAKIVYNAVGIAARTSLEMVVKAGGFCPDDQLRAVLGDKLTGKVTGPLNKHLKSLGKKGLIPEGLPKPLVSGYNGKNAWQPTQGFKMPDQLVPMFAAAIGI